VARLAEILGEDYEQVHAYLGDQGFARLVKSYIAANPSDQRSARWFGRHLPAYVRGSTAYPKHAEVAELAELEKSLRLTFATNAADVWTALKNGSAPPKPIHLPERQALIVWGQDFMARFRPLSTEEAMMWDEAAKGGALRCPVRDGGTFAGEDGAELRAASYLKGWVDTGLLTGFQLQ
jgi:hypothetical protein